MKKHCFPRIRILFSSVVFIALGLYFNAFNYLFIYYLLALIHELCHVFFAIMFHVEVEEISFHALGFSAELKDVEFAPFFKQLIIYLAGPLSFFPSLLLINILYKVNFLSIYSYKVALNDNISLLIFNLLPFYPLDGGRIFELLILKFKPVFKAKVFRSFISLFVSIILLISCIKDYQYLLFLFILFNAITNFILLKKEYRNYLLKRVGKVNFYPIRESIYPEIYHFNYNYFQINNRTIGEEDYLLESEIDLMRKRIKRN